MGVDVGFNEGKHGYVLSFPWNFPQIVGEFESDHPPIPSDSLIHTTIYNQLWNHDFNSLFRRFHQACAIPDYELIHMICEPNLAKYMQKSIYEIHYHGLDIEMANLTVDQPSIQFLKVEFHHGLSVTRSQNDRKDAYDITHSSLFGAPITYYKHKERAPTFLDT